MKNISKFISNNQEKLIWPEMPSKESHLEFGKQGSEKVTESESWSCHIPPAGGQKAQVPWLSAKQEVSVIG